MKIGAIVVLYNCNYTESKTIQTIIKSVQYSNSFKKFKLIIFDNGVLDQKSKINLDIDFEYYWNGINNGLAFAYNIAFNNYKSKSFDWLLLLDQDTTFPQNYLSILFHEVNLFSQREDVVIFAPKMTYNGNLFSPSVVKLGGIHRPLKITPNKNLLYKDIFAVGSGTLVKINFIERINGFNEDFAIDCLDRWLYLMVSKFGLFIRVINLEVNHELSILDKKEFVTIDRYRQILIAESRFIKLYKSTLEFYIFKLRLLLRAVKFLFQKSRIKYFKLILKFTFNNNYE